MASSVEAAGADIEFKIEGMAGVALGDAQAGQERRFFL
jgi:hypothetical protein